MTTLTLNQDETSVLDWLESEADWMISTVKDWSAINSGSFHREGLDRMRQPIIDAFSHLEARVEEVELATSSVVERSGEIRDIHYAPAIQVSSNNDAPVRIVMTGHYDTVFPEDSHFQDWTMWDDDTLNGPGVADMKGGLLVMLQALKGLQRSPWRDGLDFTVLISPDEEIGSHGSGPLLAELGKAAHIGMTYEPALADGSLAGGRKGSGNFSLIVKGKAAHAGREHHLGRNAIVAASQFSAALDQLNGQKDGVTINVSRIDGGGAPNVVPDTAVVRFNVRVPDQTATDWVTASIKKCVEAVNRIDGISTHLHGGFTRPPKPMTPANRQMFEWTRSAGQVLGLDIQWNDTGGVCEGNNLYAAGCPNVDTLGVRGADIHSDQEIAKLSSFDERAKLSAIMLMKFAQGHFDARQARALVKQQDQPC